MDRPSSRGPELPGDVFISHGGGDLLTARGSQKYGQRNSTDWGCLVVGFIVSCAVLSGIILAFKLTNEMKAVSNSAPAPGHYDFPKDLINGYPFENFLRAKVTTQHIKFYFAYSNNSGVAEKLKCTGTGSIWAEFVDGQVIDVSDSACHHRSGEIWEVPPKGIYTDWAVFPVDRHFGRDFVLHWDGEEIFATFEDATYSPATRPTRR